MSKENVIKFGELLRDDQALRDELQAARAAFKGDASDKQALFDATIAPLAERLELPFTYEDAFACATSEDVDEQELKAIAGGLGGCYFIGFSDTPEATANEEEMHACIFIGIGVPGPA